MVGPAGRLPPPRPFRFGVRPPGHHQRTGPRCERCPKSTRCTPAIGWGPQADYHQLVVLLDQFHYDKQDQPFMHSRSSYFIQGLFTFTVLRST